MSSDELLSALLDGECTPGELKSLLDVAGKGPALEQRWSRMCLVREAMEGTRVRQAAPDFCAGVMAAIAAEAAPGKAPKVVELSSARRPAPRSAVGEPAAAVRARRWQPLAGLATAASLAAVVAVGGYRVLNQPGVGLAAGQSAGSSSATQTAATTTAVAPQNVAVSSQQAALLPVSATVGHWSGSGLDAATARQLDEYLLEHSNMRAAQGMGGALAYPRMAVRTAEYRPGEQN